MKVADAIGAQLDWMVAKADDNLHPKGAVRLLDGKVFTIEAGDYERSDRWQLYDPSTDAAQGHPIIESEEIMLLPPHDDDGWTARCGGDSYPGPTPLIAAMRAFVASKLGEEVDVPEELCGDIK